MNALRIALLYWRVAALNELQYRANFFIQLIQAGIGFGAGVAVILLVFSHTDELNGWDAYELLALFGVQMMLGGVLRAAVQPAMQKLMDDVREGTLDYVLTKPLDAQLLVSVREARVWRLVDALGGLTIIVFAVTQVERAVGLEDAAGFLVMISLGAAMLYCFWLVLATMAFWVVRIWAVTDMFEGLYQTGRWPIGIYPGWLRYGLTFLVPIGFAVTVPARAVTARLDWDAAAGATAFALVAIVVSRAVFRRGLRSYSGASA
ncbi:MAG: ABC-2 family transporter protein [Actinomycetota bacterium]|nr:ABC-2 family transporter protein [Actinomycetota bacterium]